MEFPWSKNIFSCSKLPKKLLPASPKTRIALVLLLALPQISCSSKAPIPDVFTAVWSVTPVPWSAVVWMAADATLEAGVSTAETWVWLAADWVGLLGKGLWELATMPFGSDD